MKVNAHCSLFRPNIGGIETMVDEMHSVLQNEGAALDVVTKCFPSDLPEEETIDGVHISRIPAGFRDEDIINAAKYIADHNQELVSGDVIHIVGMRRPMPLISAIAGAVNGIPVVSSICGMEVPNLNQPESDHLWRQGAHYMIDAYRNIYRHTAVSAATGAMAKQAVPELDVTTLYAGIDVGKYDKIIPAPIIDEPYIMSLRRLEKSKGIDVLIKAYASLVNRQETLPKLAIVGDGEERANLEKLAHELDVSDRVVFAGTLPIEAAIGGLKCAEMTVVPSLAEAGGLINTEANAVSCPLITTDVGGIKEYAGEDSALFVNPGDVDMLATAMKELYNDKTLRQRMVGNGRKFAESRAWQGVIKDYLKLYETAKPIPVDKLRLSSELGKRILRILSNE